MAQEDFNVSLPNDGLGDALRAAFIKQQNMNTELYADKVDKVDGLGLSQNSFSDEEKEKLAGIETGAEVNVQSDWLQEDNTADDFIKNKPLIPFIPSFYQDRIIALGTTTIVDETVVFSIGFVWDIANSVYQNGFEITRALPYATVGYYRTDVAYLTDDNNILIQSGVEDTVITPEPAIPLGTLRLQAFNIFGETITSGEPAIFNLSINELGETPITNVNQIEFDGATVTDEGSGKVKVTIAGGGATPSLGEVLNVLNREPNTALDGNILFDDLMYTRLANLDGLGTDTTIIVPCLDPLILEKWPEYMVLNNTDFVMTLESEDETAVPLLGDNLVIPKNAIARIKYFINISGNPFFSVTYQTNEVGSSGVTPNLEQVELQGSRRGVAVANGNTNLTDADVGTILIAADGLGISADFTITIPINIYLMGSTENSLGSFEIINRSSYNCTIIADTGVFLNEVEEGTKIIPPNTKCVINSIAAGGNNDWQTFITPTDLSSSGASLIREEFTFGLSQTFTLANNYGQVYSVEVQGQGALSTSQYTLVAPNQITINDTLNTGDYVVVIYSNAITGVQPYYSQAETDALVDNVAILKSVGATYTTNAILTVTQAEYDALTPDPTTLYVIL